MKSVFTLILCLSLSLVIAQNDTLTFESISIPTDSFLNNSGDEGYFEVESFVFPNNYITQWNSWSGWAFSSSVDTLTPGFVNQYSSASGSGVSESSNYAINFDANNFIIIDKEEIESIHGIYINNSTYTRLSMLNGDSFAKKFGGETGDDPDYFLLSMTAKNGDEVIHDTIDFYLADFRSDSAKEDYIINDWTYVDLSPFVEADTIFFQLSSTDIGDFGMNTPAYFCIDNLIYTKKQNVSISNLNTLKLRVYPNPATDYLIVDTEIKGRTEYRIFELGMGRLVKRGILDQSTISVDQLTRGSYILEFVHDKERFIGKFIKP